jgi:hypothetical protein
MTKKFQNFKKNENGKNAAKEKGPLEAQLQTDVRLSVLPIDPVSSLVVIRRS